MFDITNVEFDHNILNVFPRLILPSDQPEESNNKKEFLDVTNITQKTKPTKRSRSKQKPIENNAAVVKRGWVPTWNNVVRGHLPVFVVDKHHDALKPIFDAIEEGRIPRSGNRLLHFDSHPDMANFDMSCPKGLQQDLHRGKYDMFRVHAHADIATWILPLVLAGHISETAWVSCWFCNQMDVGSYDLLVGRDAGGRLKVAAGSNIEETFDAVGLYFASRGSWVKPSQLKNARCWRLHVCRLDAEFNLPPQQSQVIETMCSNDSWLLDFDEDFVSCSNPYSMEFVAMFGTERYEVLQQLYEPADGTFSHWDILRSIVHRQIYLMPAKELFALPSVRRLLELYPQTLLEQYFEMLCQAHKPYHGSLALADLFPPTFFQNTGESIGLPHHISTAAEILQVMSTCHHLLGNIKTVPKIITAATSRCDRYLPETQAVHIHRLMINMFTKLYNLKSCDIQRLDVQLSL